jgi:hypothetical protein
MTVIDFQEFSKMVKESKGSLSGSKQIELIYP